MHVRQESGLETRGTRPCEEPRCRGAVSSDVPTPRLLAALAATVLVAGCAASQTRPTTPQRVEMEELRITAHRGEGGYEFETYDAAELFQRATKLLNTQKCREAVDLYDKLVAEFPDSAYASASLYNAGLCLQALGDFASSAEHYTAVRERYRDGEDVRDASFQLAEVLVQLERWQDAIALAEELLADDGLSSDERLEAMARRAQGLLGQHKLEEAERDARSSLSYFRTRPKGEEAANEFYAAACNYVLAETFRERAEEMAFPQGLEEQKQVLIRRAELLLEAQREYFNTISYKNLDNLYWAAASGYRIGNMYDELWHAIMSAPIPSHLAAEGREIYRSELAKLIKPLIRHAIRYWEMTLMFIERTGLQGKWADKTRADLERVRTLMLEQPPGPGGVPTPPATATEPTPSDPQEQELPDPPRRAPSEL